MCPSLPCEKCAAEIAEDSEFCRKCGHGFSVVSYSKAEEPAARAIPRVPMLSWLLFLKQNRS